MPVSERRRGGTGRNPAYKEKQTPTSWWGRPRPHLNKDVRILLDTISTKVRPRTAPPRGGSHVAGVS